MNFRWQEVKGIYTTVYLTPVSRLFTILDDLRVAHTVRAAGYRRYPDMPGYIRVSKIAL